MRYLVTGLHFQRMVKGHHLTILHVMVQGHHLMILHVSINFIVMLVVLASRS